MSASHGIDTGIITICSAPRKVGWTSKTSTPNQPPEMRTQKKGAKKAKYRMDDFFLVETCSISASFYHGSRFLSVKNQIMILNNNELFISSLQNEIIKKQEQCIIRLSEFVIKANGVASVSQNIEGWWGKLHLACFVSQRELVSIISPSHIIFILEDQSLHLLQTDDNAHQKTIETRPH